MWRCGLFTPRVEGKGGIFSAYILDTIFKSEEQYAS